MARTNFAPDDALVDYIMARTRYLSTQYYQFGIEHQEIADYIIPRKNSILVERVPGWKRTQRLFDSTAPDAAEKLAASIHGTLTSPYIQWFSLETDDEELNGVPAVADWLQQCAARMRAQFNRSNFAQESHELYLDLVTFATGCLFFEEKPRDDKGFFGGFNFKSVNVGKFLLAEGPDGTVNAVFRVFPLSAAAILERWKDAPAEAKEILEGTKDKPDKVFQIIHAVWPRRLGDKDYTSVYLLQKDRIKLSEEGFYEFPFMAPRWSKLSDETYGRGPSHTALPDVRSLNKIVELELRSLALRVQPPMASRNGDTIGPIRLVPGGHTTVRGDKDSIWPIQLGGDFQVVNLTKEDLIKSINRIYYSDELQLPQGPQMTAEEVVTRMELMERRLGPMTGRLESEFLRPCIDRAWAIMYRAHTRNPNLNVLPAIPPEIQQAQTQGKVSLRIRFEGPLARAQKSADATAIQGLATFMAQTVAPMDPTAVKAFDWKEAMRIYATVKGVPAKTIRDPAKVDQEIAEEQQAQADQMQQAKEATAAEAAGNVAPLVSALHKAPEQNSVMHGMMNNGQQSA